MRAGLINEKTGEVENVVVVTPNWVPPAGFSLVTREDVDIGDTYRDGVLTKKDRAGPTASPFPAKTTEQKLAVIGLTLEELRLALGTPTARARPE